MCSKLWTKSKPQRSHGSTVARGLLDWPEVFGPQACSYLGIYGIYYLDSDMISPFGLKKSMDAKGAKPEISHCPKKTMFIPSWIPSKMDTEIP